MLTFFRMQMATLLFVSAIALILAAPRCAIGQQVADTERDQIGEVFGKAVYRDEIQSRTGLRREDELHRLFLEPVTRRYCELHKAEIEPTPAEIDAAAAFFKNQRTASSSETDEPSLRLHLKEIETQLAESNLSDRHRGELERVKAWIEQQLSALPTLTETSRTGIQKLLTDITQRILLAVEKAMIGEQLAKANLTKEELQELQSRKQHLELLNNPDQMVAVFFVAKWKFERHLYDKYGGGRILWQQAGLEAFDASVKWLEAEEQKGNFQITDPTLRDAFYRYWTRRYHDYLSDDPDTIREGFLEPEWAPRQAK